MTRWPALAGFGSLFMPWLLWLVWQDNAHLAAMQMPVRVCVVLHGGPYIRDRGLLGCVRLRRGRQSEHLRSSCR